MHSGPISDKSAEKILNSSHSYFECGLPYKKFPRLQLILAHRDQLPKIRGQSFMTDYVAAFAD